jgi:hypothetical protein
VSGFGRDCGRQWKNDRVSQGLQATVGAWQDQSGIAGDSGSMSGSVSDCGDSVRGERYSQFEIVGDSGSTSGSGRVCGQQEKVNRIKQGLQVTREEYQDCVTASLRLWATVEACQGLSGIAGNSGSKAGSVRDCGRQWEHVRVSQDLRTTLGACQGQSSQDCGRQ